MIQATQSDGWDTLAPVLGQRPHTLTVRDKLSDRSRPLLRFTLGKFRCEVRRSHDTLWIVARTAAGGIAMRGVYSPDGAIAVEKRATKKSKSASGDGETTSLRILGSSMGVFDVVLQTYSAAMFRVTVTLKPAAALLMPPQPWNIYPIDANNDPLATRGIVHAAQRGSAAAVLYFSLTKPAVGTVLYVQNLTALNDYCTQTHTTPNTVVGQGWPGLGFLIPDTEDKPLEKGTAVGISDAYVHLSQAIPADPRASAKLFLEMLANVYVELPRPATQYRDWPKMARATRRDLDHSPKLRTEEHGYLYLRPYTAAEYPDSMVQLTVLLPLMEFADWTQEKSPTARRLREAFPNFFDPKLGTIRRYLATVGQDKNADEVDSWYLYHPLTNLARLAKRGDEEAKTLFLTSLEFGIKVAHRFKYHWPVQYNLKTLAIITDNRKAGEGGQTDVAGIYANVLLEAWEITGDNRYLAEAKSAIESLRPLAFNIGYQFNLVAIGVLACLRLFKITGDDFYRDQAEVLLASFMHNTNLWECDFGPAKFFKTFMGVTCLHDGAYMAAYEEFEAFASFHDCLQLAGDDLSRPARLLMTEYFRYALERCWYYFPSELPADQLSEDVRNGHVDRKLAMPLEDLYADWQKPGAVGQETYGAGMAFTMVTRSHHTLAGAGFMLYCDYPITDLIVNGRRATFRIIGEPDFTCRLRLIKTGRAAVRAKVTSGDGKPLTAGHRGGDLEFSLAGGSRITIDWGR